MMKNLIEGKIEVKPLEEILPYEKNAKLHPQEQIDKLMDNIQRYGWTQPIVVDADGVIIIGHGRREAARQMGLKKVQVIVRDDLTKQQVKALRIADNKVTSTEYDTDLMLEDLAELFGDAEELGLDGFLGETEMNILESMASDDDGMDMDAFSDDITGDVEKQAEENEEAVSDAGDKMLPIGKALGFTKISTDDSRTIGRFMSQVEADTELEGADALVKWINDLNEVA
jgi:ParB-like chromosome segregation protein Spo0J